MSDAPGLTAAEFVDAHLKDWPLDGYSTQWPTSPCVLIFDEQKVRKSRFNGTASRSLRSIVASNWAQFSEVKDSIKAMSALPHFAVFKSDLGGERCGLLKRRMEATQDTAFQDLIQRIYDVDENVTVYFGIEPSAWEELKKDPATDIHFPTHYSTSQVSQPSSSHQNKRGPGDYLQSEAKKRSAREPVDGDEEMEDCF